MATVYIPDILNIEVYARANEGFPDADVKDAMERRNMFVKAAIREKLDCDGGGNARA